MDQSTNCLRGLAPRRKKAGYTQEALAAALGISRSLLAAWEVGTVWPSAGRLPEMARLLGCSIEELYREPEEERIATPSCGTVRNDRDGGAGPCESIVAPEGGEAPCRTTTEISTTTQGGLPV